MYNNKIPIEDDEKIQKWYKDYILEIADCFDKYEKHMNKEFEEDVLIEKTTIGDVTINFYKTDATSLEFYFEKLSS